MQFAYIFADHVNGVLGSSVTLNWSDEEVLDAAKRHNMVGFKFYGPKCVVQFRDGSKATWNYKNGVSVIIPTLSELYELEQG